MNIGDTVLIIKPGHEMYRREGRISLIERGLYLVTTYLTEKERNEYELHLPTKTFVLSREEIQHPNDTRISTDNNAGTIE